MVEPSQFTEVYTSINECVSQSFANIDALCKHTFHIHRFHPQKVKLLNKYLEILTTQKDNIYSNLEVIQTAFDTIDNGLVLYLHNMEKVKNELSKLADLQQNELELSKKLYGDKEALATTEAISETTTETGELKPIIEIGNNEFKEEMDRIVEYIEKF